MNLTIGRAYRGINRILLSGHSHWGTYLQIQQLGGYVRKGEKAAGIVVFLSWEKRKTLRDRPLDRYYSVFHAGQCEGIDVAEAAPVAPIASCEAVLERNRPTVRMGDPAYLPGTGRNRDAGDGAVRGPGDLLRGLLPRTHPLDGAYLPAETSGDHRAHPVRE